MSDPAAIARFFRAFTGLEPQYVSGIRRGTSRLSPRLLIWSVMTEQGHFYVVEGKRREVMRGEGQRVGDLARRYLDLHPDEAEPASA